MKLTVWNSDNRLDIVSNGDSDNMVDRDGDNMSDLVVDNREDNLVDKARMSDIGSDTSDDSDKWFRLTQTTS